MDIKYIVIVLVLILIILSQFVQMRRTKEINEKLRKIVSDSNEQYQDVVEINKNLKHIRHDINKQRSIARDMDENQSVSFMTGIEVIDRILHFKGKEMSERNISFHADTVPIDDITIGHGTLISILTNIFDNAIEACEGIENPWISCKVQKDQVFGLHMIVENTKKSEVKVDVVNISTTKADRELHGYGLAIIKELIEKNSGELRIEDKGEVFYLEFKV